MKPKILIADSEEMFARAVAYVLEQAGYEAVAAHDSRLALDQAFGMDPDICILGASLQPVNGKPLCCVLRSQEKEDKHPPILVLGDQPDEDTCVALLECGADDYMVKPFGMREFLARVHALLRRGNVAIDRIQPGELRAGVFALSLEHLRLKANTESGPRTAVLTRRETQVLEQLMLRCGEYVPREELVLSIWGAVAEQEKTLSTLEVHLRSLRKKVCGLVGHDKSLDSKRGVGVRLSV